MSRLGGLCGLGAAFAGLIAAHALALEVPPLPGVTVTTPSLPVTTALPPPPPLPVTTALPPPPPPPSLPVTTALPPAPAPPPVTVKTPPVTSRRRRSRSRRRRSPRRRRASPSLRHRARSPRRIVTTPTRSATAPAPRLFGTLGACGRIGFAIRRQHGCRVIDQLAHRPRTELPACRRDAHEPPARDPATRERPGHGAAGVHALPRRSGSS